MKHFEPHLYATLLLLALTDLKWFIKPIPEIKIKDVLCCCDFCLSTNMFAHTQSVWNISCSYKNFIKTPLKSFKTVLCQLKDYITLGILISFICAVRLPQKRHDLCKGEQNLISTRTPTSVYYSRMLRTPHHIPEEDTLDYAEDFLMLGTASSFRRKRTTARNPTLKQHLHSEPGT